MFFSRQFWRVSGLLICALLIACGAPASKKAIGRADSLALSKQFFRLEISTSKFNLVSYRQGFEQGVPLRIYFAGDGRAWLSRYRASLNPTPHNPLGLKLAIQDTDWSGNKVYLARPCQFYPTNSQAACEARYWTLARYSEEVVASTNEAIDQIVLQTQPSQIEFIGFSGGAAVALLVAARRDDVSSLRTVAGNLATDFFTRYHGVSATVDSLDPVDVVSRLEKIPQRHFVGELDEAVPRQIAEHYYARLSSKTCTKIELIEGVGHSAGWLELWPKLLTNKPFCTN